MLTELPSDTHPLIPDPLQAIYLNHVLYALHQSINQSTAVVKAWMRMKDR